MASCDRPSSSTGHTPPSWLSPAGCGPEEEYRRPRATRREGIDVQFSPPVEHLAFEPGLPGEAGLLEIWPAPLPLVVETRRSCTTAQEVGERLPDVLLVGRT